MKHVHIDDDWTMRFNGDVGCHPLQLWASGLMDVLPERIDHGLVAVAAGLGRNGWGAALLMRDLSDAMVPPGDDLLSTEQHLSLIDDIRSKEAEGDRAALKRLAEAHPPGTPDGDAAREALARIGPAVDDEGVFQQTWETGTSAAWPRRWCARCQKPPTTCQAPRWGRAAVAATWWTPATNAS